MLGWTDLKAWMAACWKVSWKVDPLAWSVPESLAVSLPDAGPLLLPGARRLPDEPQAASTRAVAPRARPGAAMRWTRKRRMSVPPVMSVNARPPPGQHAERAPQDNSCLAR